MSSPQLAKAWTITPNERLVYVSLIATLGWFIYTNKTKLKAVGWTCKFSSDGITGPASGADATDRIASATDFATRATIAAAAQSWIVLQNADGLQIMFAFMGATDDVARVSYSPGGLFALAATTTQQPTATDEVIVSLSNSLINSGLSADRVMSIWCSNDTKHWSCAIFRSSAIVNIIGIERIQSYCGTGVFVPVPYVGYRYTTTPHRSTAVTPGPTAGYGATALEAAGYLGMIARVFTGAAFRKIRVGSGIMAISFSTASTIVLSSGADTFSAGSGALGATQYPMIPLYFCGEKSANVDGLLGSPIDWWQVLSSSLSSPALADFAAGYESTDTPGVSPERSNWFVVLGTAMVRPWRDAAVSLQIT